MPTLAQFRVVGVLKSRLEDVEVVIDAANEDNAKAKAELIGIAVTGVTLVVNSGPVTDVGPIGRSSNPTEAGPAASLQLSAQPETTTKIVDLGDEVVQKKSAPDLIAPIVLMWLGVLIGFPWLIGIIWGGIRVGKGASGWTYGVNAAASFLLIFVVRVIVTR